VIGPLSVGVIIIPLVIIPGHGHVGNLLGLISLRGYIGGDGRAPVDHALGLGRDLPVRPRFGLTIPRRGGFVQHLRRETTHPDTTRPQNTLPEGLGDSTARTRGPTGLAGTILRAATIGRAYRDETRRRAEATTQLEARVHNGRKELDAPTLALFGRINRQTPFFSLVPTRHIKSTAGTVNPGQTTHLQTQECVGTLFFPVRAGRNGDGSAGTGPGEALGTVVVALPQLVLGHITAQYLATHVPLGTRDAHRGEATSDGSATRRFQHTHGVSRRFVRVRVGRETKDAQKGNR
jgi:hypothetical protein